MAMTIGRVSRRTGVPVKTLRKYEDLGLIYTAGRSPANYRLFDEEALWCVGVIGGLRELGLTLAEICELAEIYLARTEDPVGPRLSAVLQAARGPCRARGPRPRSTSPLSSSCSGSPRTFRGGRNSRPTGWPSWPQVAGAGSTSGGAARRTAWSTLPDGLGSAWWRSPRRGWA